MGTDPERHAWDFEVKQFPLPTDVPRVELWRQVDTYIQTLPNRRSQLYIYSACSSIVYCVNMRFSFSPQTSSQTEEMRCGRRLGETDLPFSTTTIYFLYFQRLSIALPYTCLSCQESLTSNQDNFWLGFLLFFETVNWPNIQLLERLLSRRLGAHYMTFGAISATGCHLSWLPNHVSSTSCIIKVHIWLDHPYFTSVSVMCISNWYQVCFFATTQHED